MKTDPLPIERALKVRLPLAIETTRLRLRGWRPEDAAPFRRMNADPDVMRFFPKPLTTAESDRLLERIRQGFVTEGFGLWAVDVKLNEAANSEAPGGFAGFVGLSRTSFDAQTIEIAWRLATPFQHRGLAAEAAAAALEAGFAVFGLDRIVAFTAECNLPSQRLMMRLGMTFERRFLHPALPPGDLLAPHVLFAMTRTAWQSIRQRLPGALAASFSFSAEEPQD